jgi:hypothetical protein
VPGAGKPMERFLGGEGEVGRGSLPSDNDNNRKGSVGGGMHSSDEEDEEVGALMLDPETRVCKRLRVRGSGCTVQGAGFAMYSARCGVCNVRCRVRGLVFTVQGAG